MTKCRECEKEALDYFVGWNSGLCQTHDLEELAYQIGDRYEYIESKITTLSNFGKKCICGASVDFKTFDGREVCLRCGGNTHE